VFKSEKRGRGAEGEE
jgi:hypothetical protein